jgi:hypothetical protein
MFAFMTKKQVFYVGLENGWTKGIDDGRIFRVKEKDQDNWELKIRSEMANFVVQHLKVSTTILNGLT